MDIARKKASEITEFEADNCKKIGEHGVSIVDAISKQKNGGVVNILTHCNAGWLACVEYGTATKPQVLINIIRLYDDEQI